MFKAVKSLQTAVSTLALLFAATVAPNAIAQMAPTQAIQASANVTPVRSSADFSETDVAYVLGSGDLLRISVYNEPALTFEQRVDARGAISVPLLGDVRAADQTSTQLADTLRTRWQAGYLRDPKVTVSIVTYRPFYVTGEVEKPGAYPFEAHLTVPTAIAIAGGYARGANRRDVYVRRSGDPEERKLNSYEAAQLQPGDTVRVGRSAMSGLRDLPFGLLGWLP